ncbi:uncharacterized protein SPSK_05648 [Sporothrix schenckii 1099-18]|uniref:Uncharacterized protein n=1 Tax=Sporothrix schenckii 1099-18 TaxID=1397361 RepID=A0A0F2LVC9_SPOSC|nr:uncharacterized protein SPSK_05648 [Sporothrix schenckii 1099-18]KJR80799.1 hypothetical protein SPSK_05648 [Sporothrix schenckii 1099-18]
MGQHGERVDRGERWIGQSVRSRLAKAEAEKSRYRLVDGSKDTKCGNALFLKQDEGTGWPDVYAKHQDKGRNRRAERRGRKRYEKAKGRRDTACKVRRAREVPADAVFWLVVREVWRMLERDVLVERRRRSQWCLRRRRMYLRVLTVDGR